MENKPIVSVIIPHYNSPELLHKAIQSASVSDKVEVIVVDDKSNMTETQFATIERFCNLHYVQFYQNTTDKKGAGVCRNIGLEHMTGDWLLLLDADDYFIDDWFDVVEPYLESAHDMIFFPPLSVNLKTGKDDGRTYVYQTLVYDYLKKPSQATATALKYRFCSSWSKLVKRTVFEQNNILFDETLVSNDIMFMTKCAYFSKNIAADEHSIYMATRSGNTLTSKKNVNNLMTRVEVLIDRYKFLETRLKPEEFKQIHLSWLALARIADAFISGYGIKTVLAIYKKFKESNIKIIDKEMFYPINVYRNIKTEIMWHMGIQKTS